MTDSVHRSRAALPAMTAAFMIVMTGTTLPTAIYHDYQQRFGFSPLMITVIYAVYAIGVIGALWLAGNWSDQLGRRRVLFVGVAASAASAVVFLLAQGLPALLLGRALSGISAGLFTSTATVAVIELAPSAWGSRATLLASAANMLGLGFGPLLGGVLVDLAPWPVRLPYAVHLCLLALAAWAVWIAPETVRRPAKISLHPQQLSLPAEVRDVFAPAAIAGFAGFMVTGFFSAVAPQLIDQVLGLHGSLVVGAIVSLLFLASAFGQASLAIVAVAWRMPVGALGLLAGLLAIGISAPLRSTTALLVGAVLAGWGQGLSFRAGLASLSERSPASQKAAVTASYFVVMYVSISLPVIGVGLIDQAVGVTRGTPIFAVITGLLVVIALLLGRRTRRSGDTHRPNQREA